MSLSLVTVAGRSMPEAGRTVAPLREPLQSAESDSAAGEREAGHDVPGSAGS
jgi:hypothetical protein